MRDKKRKSFQRSIWKVAKKNLPKGTGLDGKKELRKIIASTVDQIILFIEKEKKNRAKKIDSDTELMIARESTIKPSPAILESKQNAKG